MLASVIAVSANGAHEFSKRNVSQLNLIAGQGVEGDAHCGVTVKHRSRVARDPSQPNLRQVHLIHAELFEELSAKGFHISPGTLGENITTSAIPLLSLPVGTILKIGEAAVMKLTGLRNPCGQLDDFQAGLTAAVLDRAEDGSLIRMAGVMGVVLQSGIVRAGDAIMIMLPIGEQRRLTPV